MIEGANNSVVRKQPEPVKPPPPPPPREPVRTPTQPVTTTDGSQRLAEVNLLGTQQRDRIERLFGAGAAGLSTMRDLALERSTSRANRSYFETYQRELANLRDPARTTDPPSSMIDAPTVQRVRIARRLHRTGSRRWTFAARARSRRRIICEGRRRFPETSLR